MPWSVDLRVLTRGTDALRVRRRSTRATAVCAALLVACVDDPCEESISAQVDLPTMALTIGSSRVDAEIADDDLERSRGWRHRRCDREVLALLADEPTAAPAPLPVFGCALTSAINVAFVRDGEVIDVGALAPCPEPCTTCPLLGDELSVHAVLEAPSATLDFRVGDTVMWGGDPWAADDPLTPDTHAASTTRDRTPP
jgi:uncharacterized membrane protein (UPF0127 family)